MKKTALSGGFLSRHIRLGLVRSNSQRRYCRRYGNSRLRRYGAGRWCRYRHARRSAGCLCRCRAISLHHRLRGTSDNYRRCARRRVNRLRAGIHNAGYDLPAAARIDGAG